MSFDQVVDYAGKILDGIGIGVILLGTFMALARYALRLLKRASRGGVAYQQNRQEVGRAILLGLEFLIAGDIIRTVATAPSFENVGVLGGIVLIRTFLSATLQVEVEHRWPWQKDETPAAVLES